MFDYVRARHPDAPWENGGLLLAKESRATAAATDSSGDAVDDEKEKVEDEEQEQEQQEEQPSSSRFPEHWGPEPRIQTRDYRQLPGGYGMGSGTLARWIQENLDKDKAAAAQPPTEGEGGDL